MCFRMLFFDRYRVIAILFSLVKLLKVHEVCSVRLSFRNSTRARKKIYGNENSKAMTNKGLFL